jgi:hypothetical protein
VSWRRCNCLDAAIGIVEKVNRFPLRLGRQRQDHARRSPRRFRTDCAERSLHIHPVTDTKRHIELTKIV